MMCDVLVYRARRSESRIRQMLWKVNYSDIVFINTVCVAWLLASDNIHWISLDRSLPSTVDRWCTCVHRGLAVVMFSAVFVCYVNRQELISCWDGRPFGHNRRWSKSGGGLLCRLRWGKLRPHVTQCVLAEVYLRTKWHVDPSKRFATIHQRYRQTGQTGQRSRSIGQTVTCNGRPIIEIVVMDFHEIHSGP